MIKSVLCIVAVLAIMTTTSILTATTTVYGCQTHAIGCQKTQEGGTPAGDSPPEVSGCHFFEGHKQCVRDSTPP